MKNRHIISIPLVTAVSIAALTTSVPGTAEAGPAADCPTIAGVNPNVWVGLGSADPDATSSEEWNDPDNWSRGAVAAGESRGFAGQLRVRRVPADR